MTKASMALLLIVCVTVLFPIGLSSQAASYRIAFAEFWTRGE